MMPRWGGVRFELWRWCTLERLAMAGVATGKRHEMSRLNPGFEGYPSSRARRTLAHAEKSCQPAFKSLSTYVAFAGFRLALSAAKA